MSTVQTRPLPANVEAKFISSSLGKKVFMAVTGLLLVLWVTGHLIGNLQIFMGQNQLNKYAQALKDAAALIWVVRLIMLTVLGIHVWRGIQLYLENRASRPVRYAVNKTNKASLASRTMIWSGLGIFTYLIYHLLQFTFVTTNPEFANLHDSLGRHDVYSMVVLGFQNVIVSVVYIIAMFFLFYHLSHAVKSMFQTMGFNNDRWESRLTALAYLVATFFFVGYSSIPVAVLLNIIKLPGGVH